jgi:hypothetical protein
MLLAVPALALLSAPAMAKPDLPPGTLRTEVQMRIQADGRADRQIEHAARPSADAYQSTARDQKPTFDRLGRESHFVAPLKASIALKIQNGDNREGSSAARQAAATPQAAQSKDNLRPSHFAPPLKTQIALKIQNGDNRDTASGKGASRPADRSAKDEHKAPLSKSQKEALCRQTGVCIPYLQGSDDADDKVE